MRRNAWRNPQPFPPRDEYDAAQERGEVAGQGKPSKTEGLATTADIGLTHKDIHEARPIKKNAQR